MAGMWACLLLLAMATTCLASESYYDILGVTKDSDDRDIRKAFKKLALALHPDKNKDDSESHEKFLKVTRAYETLKDPDLRKRYDLYGEEGQQPRRGYQSWSYYNENFGIYDDDPEIITLGRAEFEQSVLEGESDGEAWFVNFYSGACHHCHQLAPTWRRVARRLQGVIRVAAVNCEEDWVLCRNQRIQSYPSLVYYPTVERYRSERVEEDLVQFVLERVRVRVHEVTSSSWPPLHPGKSEELEQHAEKTRILFYSHGEFEGEGPVSETRLKLAVMLDGLCWVGHVDCETERTLCESLGLPSSNGGTAVWPTLPAESAAEQAADEREGGEKGPVLLSGLEAQDLLSEVLALMPEPPLIQHKSLQDLQAYVELSGDSWLLYLHLGGLESARLELRRLPAKISSQSGLSINLARVDCARSAELCEQLNVRRFPMYAVFKPQGNYELYHGRDTPSDVARFARDSAMSQHVATLTPADFDDHGPILKDGPFLIDFFAPWCPPCLRLLPELRRASQQVGGAVRVGTVDCTVHANLCRRMHVTSYPTTKLFVGSRVEQYSGEHAAQSIAEFVLDLLNPIVVELTDDNFEELLGGKQEDEMWLVDYFAPWCGPCQQLAPHWRKLAKTLVELPFVKVGSVDCERFPDICSQQGVRSYPAIRLYPMGNRGLSQVALYSGYQRDASSLRQWVMNFVPSAVFSLNEENFQSVVMQSSVPWLVDFYAPWCGHCVHFAPEFELTARRLSGRVRCGKLDCQTHRGLCHSVGISAYPTLRLYQGSTSQRPNYIELGTQPANKLADMVLALLHEDTGQHDEL